MSDIAPLLELIDEENAIVRGRFSPARGTVTPAAPLSSEFGTNPYGRSWVKDALHHRWEDVWKDIQGQAVNQHKANPDISSGAAIGHLSNAIGQLHAAAQILGEQTTELALDTAQNLRELQTNLYSALGTVDAALQDQINAINRGVSAGTAQAVAAAVAQANAHSDAVARLIEARITAERADELGRIGTAEHQAKAQAQAAQAAAQAHADAEIRYVNNLTQAQIRSVQGDLKSDVLNLNSRIDSVHTQTEGDITRALNDAEAFTVGLLGGVNVPGLAGQVNGLAQQTARLATETDDCLKPLCDTVTPNASQLGKLGGLLKALEGGIPLAALFGFVGWAATDPAGAAAGTDEVLGPVVGGLADAAKALAGLV